MIQKHRAWHRRFKDLHTVVVIDWIEREVTINNGTDLPGDPYEEWPFDEIDLEASIGRKDKNGKDIYEGDRITAGYQHDGVNNYDYDVTGRVSWDKQALQWVIISDTPGHSGWYPICSFDREELDEESVEIIGNIHEEASK